MRRHLQKIIILFYVMMYEDLESKFLSNLEILGELLNKYIIFQNFLQKKKKTRFDLGGFKFQAQASHPIWMIIDQLPSVNS